MLPSNRSSLITIAGKFYNPDDLVIGDLTDFEYGGVALNDASQGLMVQPWVLTYRETAVVVTPMSPTPSDRVPITLFERAGITALSLAFDQNMKPVVAFELQGRLWLWWYDSVYEDPVFSDFGEGRCPRTTLDDKRASQTANSDVIFAYIREDKLCYRQQRDRFTREFIMRQNVNPMTRLKNMGLTDKMRFQFELV